MGSELDRPEALTPEVRKGILDAIALGLHLETACNLNRITLQAVRYWRGLVEQKVPHALKYADFFQALKQAEATAEATGLGVLKMGMPGWQAQAWFLERRFPKRWGKKDKLEIETNFDPSKLSDEDLAAISKPTRRRRT